MFDAVFINGTVGSGKSTTATALSKLLWERKSPHALIDLDQIRLLFPPPLQDPFQHEVELANLSALVANYRAAGAEKLIVAGVLEVRTEIPRYTAALHGSSMLICRLVVDHEVARRRLLKRHADDPDGRDWHLDRLAELDAVLDRSALDDLQLDTTHRTADEVARQIQHRAGW